MLKLKFLLLAGLVAFTNASCANSCSGHGQCGANDRCTCYAAWQGSDCSQRSCPYGNAWVDTASATDTAHNYAECSNRGACDRKTGLCACADGYTGMACARTTCPSNCNGHGTCETIAELAVDTSAAVGGKTHAVYGSWDASKTRGCKCDARYTGHDCSARMCPRGDDPLTTEVDISQTETTSLQVVEVQNVTVQSVNAPINGGQVTFTYTDLYNGVWTTRPVDLPLVKTWNNKNTKIKNNPHNWQLVAGGKHISVFGNYVQLDATTGESFVVHTLDGAIDKTVAAFQLRKGDFIQIGAADGIKMCTCTLYEDVGIGTDVKCLVPIGQGGTQNTKLCHLAAGSSTSMVYSAWSVASPGAAINGLGGGGKSVTAYVSATGVITTEAVGVLTEATDDADASPLSTYFPGQWVRVYDEDEGKGAYCDFQINALPTGNTGITVSAASATSTKVDSSTGVGNSGGSNACNDFSGKTYALALIQNTQSLSTKSGDAQIFPKLTGTADAWHSTLSNGVVTMTRLKNDGSASPFVAIEYPQLQAGALLYMYKDAAGDGTGAINFQCVCRISSYIADALTNQLQCVDSGPIAGATFTQCSAALLAVDGTPSDQEKAMVMVASNNGLFFDPGADDSANNPGYFTGLQAGDQVAVTNPYVNDRNGAVTYTIDSVDPTLGRAIYFKTGSAPNGGGMYPIIPVRIAVLSTRIPTVPTSLNAGTVVQAVHTANCAATWCATDAAASNSAKDAARVLQELPNQVLSDVTVAMTSYSLGLYAYSLTFGGSRSSGDQTSVIMNGKGCNIDGCQPRYTGVRTQTSFLATCSQTVNTLACPVLTDTGSGLMVATDDMSPTGGEDLVLYQSLANNGKRFAAASSTDTTVTFKYATAAVVSATSTGVLVLRASGEWSTGNGGDPINDATTHRIQNFKSETYEITRGTTESTECSGRGNCDSETGLCECAEGYTGEACGTQSVLV